MDIIPLNNKKTAASTPAEKRLENPDTNENLIQNAEGHENAKPSQHVYPVTVPDEATGAKYFAKEVSKNSKANVAIKVVESQTMHLLSSAPKSLLLSKVSLHGVKSYWGNYISFPSQQELWSLGPKKL